MARVGGDWKGSTAVETANGSKPVEDMGAPMEEEEKVNVVDEDAGKPSGDEGKAEAAAEAAGAVCVREGDSAEGALRFSGEAVGEGDGEEDGEGDGDRDRR